MASAPSKPGVIPMRFRIHSRTDVGRRRKRNEDSLGVIARHGVFVVADGMGGVDGGDFCSRHVVDKIVSSLEGVDPNTLTYPAKLNLLEKAIVDASAEIKREADVRGICGMGTTVAVLCFNLDTMRDACVLHVGDSRVYRYRDRELTPLTVDHSMAAESGLSDSALIPVFMAGVITRAVGVRAEVTVDRTPVDVRGGDVFVICSDGLYNMVNRTRMASFLSHGSPDPAADLVNAANDAGGFDNITVILVEVLRGADGRETLADTQG